MNEQTLIRRYIVCVDGVDDSPGTHGFRNPSSILRIHASIKQGTFIDERGRSIAQNARYYQAIPFSSSMVAKLGGKDTETCDQQIREIVLDICKSLENSADEILLFGSGRGAYTVRAVTGILYHMGIPKLDHLKDFTVIYDTTLNLIKARKTEDSRRGGPALDYLRKVTHGIANISFVGLLDATKPPTHKDIYDTSTVSTIKNFRHAMAFNENRPTNSLDIPETPLGKDLVGRSFIQAWFLGYHTDLVGGGQHDGFSIYALQWIMIEAILTGLLLSFDAAQAESIAFENPLALAFPQHAGHAPALIGSEDDIWRLRYANKIETRMFDLQSIHIPKQRAEEASHTLRLDTNSPFYNAPRRIFKKSREGLIDYQTEHPYGTIIHPSVFCILDRNQAFLDQKRFDDCRDSLADFETSCLHSESTDMPPWLQGHELLASGVKAFRILVCGKTGVGKSTLINKVFGVEMTEESDSYDQGQHNINKAFESPNHPGLLIHDSRGWQAGSDQELELIAQFLRHRAFQKNPAEALHVIWFCVDSDVSRIEEADRRTFETIAQYSNTVPVFVVGTKKDKLIAYRKVELLEEYMQRTNDYQESNRLANAEADKLAEEQFATLRGYLARIESYRVDGYVCISKNDNIGIRSLLTQTLEMIADERVRLFCVAAQVVDVDQKIDSAISECMRLGTHAIRTSMVPLPFSGMVSTPTVSRIICEHVLLCFGFPKSVPDEVDEVMNRVVLGNLTKYLALSMAQFIVMAAVSSGLAVATFGVGSLAWLASPFLSAPLSARMVLKCSAEMILILERSFRYNGKYVSVRQIEDAAKQYVSIDKKIIPSDGKTKKLQEHIRDEIDRLIPLKKISVGFRFNKLRIGLKQIIYENRFDEPPVYEEEPLSKNNIAELDAAFTPLVEAPGDSECKVELRGDMQGPVELDSTPKQLIAELPGAEVQPLHRTQNSSVDYKSESATADSNTIYSRSETISTAVSDFSLASTISHKLEVMKSETPSSGSRLLSRMSKSLRMQRPRTKG